MLMCWTFTSRAPNREVDSERFEIDPVRRLNTRGGVVCRLPFCADNESRTVGLSQTHQTQYTGFKEARAVDRDLQIYQPTVVQHRLREQRRPQDGTCPQETR